MTKHKYKYGSWGYFKQLEKNENNIISDINWIKNRRKQYIEINKPKYIVKIILCVILTMLLGKICNLIIKNNPDNIEITAIIIVNSVLVLIPLICTVWTMLPPENSYRFIEWSYINLDMHEIKIFRAVGMHRAISNKTVLIGPMTYEYKFIDHIEKSEDRLVIYFRENSPYKTSFKTLQNNFNNEILFNRLKEEVDRHAHDSKKIKAI